MFRSSNTNVDNGDDTDSGADGVGRGATTAPATATIRAARGIDPKALDVLLSNELAKLSVRDREVLLEQLHGISTGMSVEQETPELLESALNLMAYEIDFFMQPKHKRSYLEAITKYPVTTYVKSNDFRLRFLRCEQYDVKKAAKRMVRFLDLVREVFGSELLKRPIRLSDVTTNAEEMDLIRSGVYSLLPSKDRAGRRIFASVGDLSLTYSLLPRVKLTMYMFWIATEDVEAQMNGLVIVMWPGADAFELSVGDTSGGGGHLDSIEIEKDKKKVDQYFGPAAEDDGATNAAGDDDDKSVSSTISIAGAKLHLAAAKMFGALPVRVVGHHCCGFPDTPLFQLVKGLVVLSLGKQRNTLRFHGGSATEIRYKLMGFGIPGDLVPMTDTGNVKNKNQLHWLTVRRALESQRSLMGAIPVSELPIEVPLCFDVLFRYGQPFITHRGNMYFHEVVAARYERHRDSNNDEKIKITWEVVDEIERRGRFLTWDRKNSWWVEIDNPETKRSKAATAFKEHGRRLRQQANLQKTQSCSQSLDPAFKKQKVCGPCD